MYGTIDSRVYVYCNLSIKLYYSFFLFKILMLFTYFTRNHKKMIEKKLHHKIEDHRILFF